jgi:hypothetical protein
MTTGRKKWLGILAVVFLGAVVVVVMWPREKEPEYHGRKLRSWLESYYWVQSTNGSADEQVAAIRAIGPAAVPTLLRWMEAYRDDFRIQAYFRMPKAVRETGFGRLVGRPLGNVTLASLGFKVLQENGVSGAHRLGLLMVCRTNDLYLSHRSYRALEDTGKGFDTIRADLTNSDANVRAAATNILRIAAEQRKNTAP